MEEAGKERTAQERRHEEAVAELGTREKRMAMMAVGVGALATAVGAAAIVMALI